MADTHDDNDDDAADRTEGDLADLEADDGVDPDEDPHADISDRYQKTTLPLGPGSRWKAAPGNQVLVIERGAVRFEYPQGWHVIPTKTALGVHDKRPPADECRVQITVFHLPPVRGNWNDLPIDALLQDITDAKADRKTRKKRPGDKPLTRKQRQDRDAYAKDRKVLHGVTRIDRPDLSYAWCESSAPDPENGRTILTRQVIARARRVQPLITFDYYASRAEDFLPVWQHLVDSLRLGAPVNLLGEAMN